MEELDGLDLRVGSTAADAGLQQGVESVADALQQRRRSDPLIRLIEADQALLNGRCGPALVQGHGYSEVQCHILRIKLGQLRIAQAVRGRDAPPRARAPRQ